MEHVGTLARLNAHDIEIEIDTGRADGVHVRTQGHELWMTPTQVFWFCRALRKAAHRHERARHTGQAR